MCENTTADAVVRKCGPVAARGMSVSGRGAGPACFGDIRPLPVLNFRREPDLPHNPGSPAQYKLCQDNVVQQVGFTAKIGTGIYQPADH